MKGKFDFWDGVISKLPDDVLQGPVLDGGCGRGLVLIKVAKAKKELSQRSPSGSVAPVYGIDIFDSRDQSGNSPQATCQNAQVEKVAEHVVLHTASFTDLPFSDGTFGLVTSSLAREFGAVLSSERL